MVTRRLELLGAEVAAWRGAPPPSPSPAPGPAAGVPVPGRHAAQTRLTIGPAQLAVVAVVVLVALGATAWWVLGPDASAVTPAPPPPSGDLLTLSGTATPMRSSATTGAVGQVTVDVAGRVRRPGIAVLEAGSRVVDAIEAAGGARPGVDLTGLNLARVLVDGEQIVVGIEPPAGVAGAMDGTGSPVADLVSLNTADQVALESLPEIGPVTAQAILTWRTEHGGFTSVDQLLDVDGIGEATLAKLAPYLTL